MSVVMRPVVVSRGGRSFDFAGFRVRLEAGQGDDRVPEVVAVIVQALTEWQDRYRSEMAEVGVVFVDEPAPITLEYRREGDEQFGAFVNGRRVGVVWKGRSWSWSEIGARP